MTNEKKMTKEERMKEIMKASPYFGKRVGYKICVVDELESQSKKMKVMKPDKVTNCKNFRTCESGKWTCEQ